MEDRRYSSWLLERALIGDTLRLRIGITKIGRHSSCGIRVESNYVSRFHAEIEVSSDDRTVAIKDLGSCNGIYVNNKLFKNESVVVIAGDRIGIGVYVNEAENHPNLDHPIYELRLAPIIISSVTSNLPDICKHALLPASNPPSMPCTSQNIPPPDINKLEESPKKCTLEKSGPEPEKHEPILNSIKREVVNFVSSNVQEIFGDPDELILKNIKEQEPLVFYKLNTGKKPPLLNGEFISLSSDEEDCEESCPKNPSTVTKEDAGTNKESNAKNPSTVTKDNAGTSKESNVKNPSTVTKNDAGTSKESNVKNPSTFTKEDAGPSKEPTRTKSPSLFDDSLNTSKEQEKLENIKLENMDDQQQSEELIFNVDEDEECCADNLMFSQVIRNEMIDELNCEDVEDEFKELDELLTIIKKETVEENDMGCSSKVKIEKTNNSIDFIDLVSDDEEYDEDLEAQVTGWSNKLLSQSFINKSQVYDDNEDESNDSCNVGMNENNEDLYGEKFQKERVNEERDEDNWGAGREKFQEANKKQELDGNIEAPIVEKMGNDASVEAHDGFESIKIAENQEVASTSRKESSLNREISSAICDSSSSPTKSDNQNQEIISCQQLESGKISSPKVYSSNLSCDSNTAIKASSSSKQLNSIKLIEAQHLPKRRRSTKTPLTTSDNSSKTLNDKYNSTRNILSNERRTIDLKQKWLEKPSIDKKRKKDCLKLIKEDRQKKLKELAAKSKKDESQKRKNTEDDDSFLAKKPKIKITHSNRGAFLTEELEKRPQSRAFKIPKKTDKEVCPNRASTTPQCDKNPTTSEDTKEDKNNTQAKQTSHSVESSKKPADEFVNFELFKKCAIKPTANSTLPKSSSVDVNTANTSVEAKTLVKRATNTKKLTFASMEKNFEETNNFLEKTKSILSKVNSSSKDKTNPTKKKKSVRFNDTPTIHIIERIAGSVRPTWKDVVFQTTYKDRFRLVRGKYAIIDFSENIKCKILSWSDTWLKQKNGNSLPSSEMITPLPNEFSSYEQYKSTYFMFMKLEYLSMLERSYPSMNQRPALKGLIQNVVEEKFHFTLVTKVLNKVSANFTDFKFDIVLVEFDITKIKKFGYVSAWRKGVDTLHVDVLSENLTKEFMQSIKQVQIFGVIDNVRVEFGAYNAVYQLKETPLFKQVLKPLELLKTQNRTKANLVYKGCDPLNEEQKAVLMNTYSRVIDEKIPNITLIQGPPGTGKSCVIRNLALQCLYGNEVRFLDKKILICAQSNCAVDVIASNLYRISSRMRTDTRFRIVRFGVTEKIAENTQDIAIQNIVRRAHLRKCLSKNNIEFENQQKLKDHILLLEAQIMEIKNSNYKGTSKEDELIEKEKQLLLLQGALNQVMGPEDERNAYTWFLNNANIVCTTLSSCVKLSTYIQYFDICIIDEATQCTEPWTLLPLKFGVNSLVLIGDTQQLPATVLSKTANDYGLGTSMFTRIQRCLEANKSTGLLYTLREQYRMHPEICKWPNSYFYKNDLKNAPITMLYKPELLPFAVLSLSYNQNRHCTDGKIINQMEADFVAKLLSALSKYFPTDENTYGVITPYSHHRKTLETVIKTETGFKNIMVNTIDSYQGIEKDVIIISNARTNGIGFLANYQRLNVALTRPKKCLLLCGNFSSLESVPVWRSLLNNARERKLYFEISDNCTKDIDKNIISKLIIKPQT